MLFLRSESDSADAPWTPLCDGRRFVVRVSAYPALRAGPHRLHAGHRPGGGPAGLHEKVILMVPHLFRLPSLHLGLTAVLLPSPLQVEEAVA